MATYGGSTLHHRNGKPDHHEPRVNLVRDHYEAAVSVYYTKRTLKDKVDTVPSRSANANNRYSADCPQKLFLSPDRFSY